MEIKRRKSRLISLFIAISDVLLLISICAVSSSVFTAENFQYHFVLTAATLAPIFLISAFLVGLYDRLVLYSPTKSISCLVISFMYTSAVFSLLIFFSKMGGGFSRLVVLSTLVSGFVGVLTLRLAVWVFEKGEHSRTLGRVAFVLDRGDVLPFDKTLDKQVSLILRAPDFAIDGQYLNSESMTKLAHTLVGIERVLIAQNISNFESWCFALKCLGVRAEVVVPNFKSLEPVALGYFHNFPTLVISGVQMNERERLLKRSFDIVFSLLAIVLFSPIFLVLGLVIKIDSPGPIFFKQDRIGYKNRVFSIYKFRSMYVGDPKAKDLVLTERFDPRVTRIGAFMRRTSLDELPQLFNVLLGDMSVVGPRPHAAQAMAGRSLYWEVDSEYWRRHRVKPGITGLAQVRGHRGNTFTEEHLQKRLKADLEYMSSWSLSRDLWILVRTLSALVGRNAF